MKSFSGRIIFGGIGIFLILTFPLFAQEGGQVLSLNLEEVTRIALENNFDIQVYRLDRLIKEEDILAADSIYDNVLSATYKYDEDRREPSSTLAGTRTNRVEQSFDLSRKLPSGTILSLGAAHKREYSDSAYTSPNPYHNSRLEASLRQPLLRDALGLRDRNNLKITRLDIDNSGYTSWDKIEIELADTQKAYWLLVLTEAKIDVQSEMEKAAEKLYQRSRNNFGMGIMEEAELFGTAANLKERQRDAELAKDNLNYAMNELRFKLNLPREVLVKCRDEISFPNPGEIDEVRLINTAFLQRRDYQSAKNAVKSENLALEMKKNALWPQLDIVGTFKRNNVDAKFGKSVGDIFDAGHPEYIAGIEFTFPLQNREAKAEFNRKKLEKARAIIKLKRTEGLILTELNSAISRLRSAREAAKLQERALEFQERKYLAEGQRFKRGRSDTDRFIRYQQDFLQAKLKYLDVLYAYITADIDLKLTLNVLLEETKE